MREVGLPSRKLLIDRLDLLVDRERKITRLYPVDTVRRAGFDDGERVEHIGFHHQQLGHAVEHDRVPQSHQVDPSAAALTTGHGTVLMANGADLRTGLVKQLRGERTCANTGAICLEDTIHLSHFARSDSETCTSTRTNGIA